MSPYLSPSSTDNAAGPLSVQDLKDAEKAGGHGSVLVVEDDWLVSTEIQSVLEDAGFAVVGIAGSAEEAVDLAGRHGPDLVLMDIRLRGLRDGIDAAIEIKSRYGLRCLFVSAHRDPATQDRAQAVDPLGWVSKPFSGQQVIAAVREALRRL
jgi:two-component system, response regulator PdtaR